MKLTAILLLITFLQTSATGLAQVKITLSVKNAPIEVAFKMILKQSGYYYFGDSAVLKNAKPVSLDLKEASLTEALDKCFEGQPLTYEIQDKIVLVKAVVPHSTLQGPGPVHEIVGKIVGEDGEPLEGITIAVKGTAQKTMSNALGEFHLKETNTNALLVFSSVQYQTRELSPVGKPPFIITLHKKIAQLDQAVIIAYGTTTKRLYTGDVATVNSETIGEQPVSNPLETLQGSISGLSIVQNTGVPGGSMTVRLRGQNSISSGNNPLYIVDGVPYSPTSLTSNSLSYSIIGGGSPLNDLNPADIESISILKDADATAIYGSRGANGVILITTKKGAVGKTQVGLNAYTGAGKVTRFMPVLNGRQYLDMRYEAFANDSETIGTANPDYDLLNWDTAHYTDWQKTLFGHTAHYTDVEGTISGGNVNTQFLMGGGFHRETTVFPGDFSDQKASVHLNINHTSTNHKFKANLAANYVSEKNNLFSYDLTGYLTTPPVAPALYDSTGQLNWAQGTFSNPLANLLAKYNANVSNLVANSMLSYQLFPRLVVRASLGYTKIYLDEIQTNPLNSFNPAYGYTAANTYSYFGNDNLETWIAEPQMEYSLPLLGGRLDALAGATFEQDLKQQQVVQGTGYSSEALMETIAGASSLSTVSASYTQYRYNAFFGRLNYNWQDKYIINLTARRDGSSRFGPDRQFADFGAVGAAWLFTNEPWIKNSLPFLSFGKLRGSYGITGNDQITDYQYLDSWSATTLPYQGNAGLQPARLYNPYFSWEKNKKLEIGLELGFAKDKILFTASAYRNRSSNQLLNYPLAPSTGFTGIQANLPALVQNEGLEFEINTINIKTSQFNWTTGFNLTIPENKLLAYPNLAGSSFANTYVVGKSLYTKKLFHYTGVDPTIGIYTFATKNASGVPTYPTDLQAVKQVAQAYYGGFQNTFSYRGFKLNVLFQFVKQTGFNYISYSLPPGSASNQPTWVLNRWTHLGQAAPVERFTQDYGSTAATAFFNSQEGDNSIGDASFIRLKNLSLSYQLKDAWVHLFQLSSGRVYFQAENLITITKYKGLDPENQSFTLPPLRVITGGIQLNF